MTSQQSQKELVEELNKQRLEISKLRDSLNEIDKEKEAWFAKKEQISKTIKENIKKIKELKEKRDSLTKEVKELKLKRDGINKETQPKFSELDKIRKEKDDISKSSNLKEPPFRIKQQIEKLEFKMETEPMSFDKEQTLMKKIKQLKKIYNESAVLNETNKTLRSASHEIKSTRKEADEIHSSIQQKAKDSQAAHEEILKLSAEIDKIKPEEEAAFKKFTEFKTKFNETNAVLKEKLKGINSVRGDLDKIFVEKKEKRKQEQESFLKSREEEVNEKIRKGQKLTTEDLLVFQSFERD